MTNGTSDSGDTDIDKVIKACEERLGSSAEWKPFDGYPHSLALCILDSIWSIGAHYSITRGVVQRYRSRRRWQGNPDQDGLPELLALYAEIGGIQAFIDEVGTRNRVSTQPGAMSKGEAVFLAATSLNQLGVATADQFRDADGTTLGEQLRDAWCAIPGQGSGVSWRYLRMLVGLPDVKPDRMVIRFLATALNEDESTINAVRAVTLVQAAAAHFDVDQRALDHEIWQYQSGRRGGHDPVSEQEQLSEVARSFIGAAFPALDRFHVIPTPPYHPFVQVGRDFYGEDVRGAELEEFVAVLELTYPERFADPMKKQHPEFPEIYAFRFLEGAIRRCSAEDEYEPDGRAVQDSIDELIWILETSVYVTTCCRATSHLTVVDAKPMIIGELTIYPESTKLDLLDQTRHFIPATDSAFNRERPFFYDPPHSLIVTTSTTSEPDPYRAAAELAARIDRFILITRLLYAGTHESAWQVAGESTLISRFYPLFRTFKKSSVPNLLMQRVLELAPEKVSAIDAVSSLVDAAIVKRDKMVATSFDVALFNYTRSHEQDDNYDRVIDLATALEAVLTGSDDDTEGVGLRLRTRAAALLWTDDDSGRAIFDDVKHLYNLRSRLVHGAKITEKELLKWLKAVSTVPNDAPYGVAFAFAVDRLRDLVRRSFLARLCLSFGENPLWQFETSAPVDAALSDEIERAVWRQSWRDVLASLGAAEAANAAKRGVDPIGSSAASLSAELGKNEEHQGNTGEVSD